MEDSRLERIEPRVRPDLLMVIGLEPAMYPDLPDLGREFLIVGDDHPSIPETAEVLRREEGEDGGITERASRDHIFADLTPCPDRLGRIFEEEETVPVRDRAQFFHHCHLTEEVDGYDRPRPLGDRCLDLLGIDIETLRFDIDEDGSATRIVDRAGCREEGEGNSDHLIPLFEL